MYIDRNRTRLLPLRVVILLRLIVASSDKNVQEDVGQALSICLPEHENHPACSESECLRMIAGCQPDLIIADSDLGDHDVGQMIGSFRLQTTSPIIVLSYIKDESAYVQALEAGADDYCVKPVRQLEFGARVRSLLRKSGLLAASSPKI